MTERSGLQDRDTIDTPDETFAIHDSDGTDHRDDPPDDDDGQRLDLLLPGDMPVDIAPDPAESAMLRDVLSGLLDALEMDHAARLVKVEGLLSDLVPPDTLPVEISTAGLPLTPFQASDYDRYFRVDRFATTQPARAMLRSLLQTVHAVTRLFCRSGALPDIHVKRQIDGFVIHTHLLARVFGLGSLR